jgi:hypothetical protein
MSFQIPTNLSAGAQVAFNQVIAGGDTLIHDVARDLATVPPPAWVLPLVPYAAELLPILQGIITMENLLGIHLIPAPAPKPTVPT